MKREPILWDPHFLARSPVFEALKGVAAQLDLTDWPSPVELSRAASNLLAPPKNAAGQIIAFVEPTSGNGSSYEQRIHECAKVICRKEDWHDFLNALVWMTFPKAKAALNARHVLEIQREPPGKRGRLRDALTLFDEGGAVVCSSSPALLELIRDFRWKDLFWRRRDEFRSSTQVFIFGHAMYQKLLDPFLGVSALAILFQVNESFCTSSLERQLHEVDALVAHRLMTDKEFATPRDLDPLPILGVPGWFAENSMESFYDNKQYFRPGRNSGPAKDKV